jgi:hypothetical protein
LADGIISWIFHHTQLSGTFAQRLSLLFGHFQAALQYPLRIACRLFNNLWAFPSVFAVKSAYGKNRAISFLFPSKQRVYNSLYLFPTRLLTSEDECKWF